MALVSGTKLGPYEIVSPLGAGGMGEVYRARDPRLKREVAIKVLPVSFSSDPQRLRRFEQEAHAAAALSHPNILAVHDIGQHDGYPYIVSELLEGETLRDKLRGGPVPVRKAVEYTLQIARGLAAAHEKGIVHRDLKPDNIFVTRDGRVKILDFGLAKLTRTECTADDETRTMESDPGSVVGTMGYMAPEQVRGKPTDARTDLFALGAILYELLSGQRAFKGTTAADTISAILHQDPPELSSENGAVPPSLERIVRHCLEKSPEERFQSAHDVAFDLESVTESSATVPTAQVRFRQRWRAAAAGVAILVATGLGAVLARTWLARTTTQPEFRRLTFRRGSIRMARFAPDGQTIVYGAAWDGKPVEVFTMRYESGESHPLGIAGAQVLSISRNDEVALLLNPEVRNFVQVGTLAVMPLSGGTPRELLADVQFAEWAPDGRTMAIVRYSAASGLSWIEYPAGNIIYRGSAWIGHLRISPDGKYLALAQHIHNGDDGHVVILDANGNKRLDSQVFTSLQGLAWQPDGKQVWFTGAPSGAARAIYALNMAGKQRLVLRAPGALVLHDVAGNGRVLLTNDNNRKQMFAFIQGYSKERNVSWLDWSVLQVLSEDGKQVLFTEGGEANQRYGLYLRRLDGSLPKRIVDGYWGDLSPDGRWVVAQDLSNPPQFVLVPTGVGQSRQITHDELIHLYPRFTPDGKAIVFAASTQLGGIRMYYQGLDGGAPVSITAEGSGAYPSLITLSADGTYLIAPGGESYAMYTVRGGQPRSLKGLSISNAVVNWSTDGKYLYVYRRGEVPARIYRAEIASGKRELFKVTSPPDIAGVEDVTSLYITRDGKSYAYTVPTLLSDLYLVNGLR